MEFVGLGSRPQVEGWELTKSSLGRSFKPSGSKAAVASHTPRPFGLIDMTAIQVA
jgi:hypothetical protein